MDYNLFQRFYPTCSIYYFDFSDLLYYAVKYLEKLTVDTTIDYTVLDLDKLVKADSTMKQFVDINNNLTLDGVQDLYEALGATCKVK